MTKYDFTFPDQVVSADINRLTNQLWKLIPMREHEENWLGQLETVTIEIVGLKEIFLLPDNSNSFLRLLTKLEGLKSADVSFESYRKAVFESISLLRGMRL
jgi:hypothetical protein